MTEGIELKNVDDMSLDELNLEYEAFDAKLNTLYGKREKVIKSFKTIIRALEADGQSGVQESEKQGTLVIGHQEVPFPPLDEIVELCQNLQKIVNYRSRVKSAFERKKNKRL